MGNDSSRCFDSKDLPSMYRNVLSDVTYIRENSKEFDIIWGVRKALCCAELVDPKIAAVELVVDRFNKFMELISSDGDNALDFISSMMEKICLGANIEQTTMEQVGVINSMRTAMIAKKHQSTYESSLSNYEKDVEIAVSKPFELVKKKSSIRNCLLTRARYNRRVWCEV